MQFFWQIHQDGPHLNKKTTPLTSGGGASNIPAFASGLGMTLEPVKAATKVKRP